jgi:putative acyl-CoA dehydrogenase
MAHRPAVDEEAFNQSPPLADVNLFTSDQALAAAVELGGVSSAQAGLEAFGALAGSAEALELGRSANDNPPRLKSFDPQGRRIDRVEFHPSYHAVMAISAAQGLHCSTWEHLLGREGARSGAHVARCAGSYMAAQMEPGHCCPITMTHAVVASLRHEPGLARQWLPKILVRDYDPSPQPAEAKRAVTFGMGMTERQGGTDVRANTTRAKPVDSAGPGNAYVISGHKWFVSAPMSDVFSGLGPSQRRSVLFSLAEA